MYFSMGCAFRSICVCHETRTAVGVRNVTVMFSGVAGMVPRQTDRQKDRQIDSESITGYIWGRRIVWLLTSQTGIDKEHGNEDKHCASIASIVAPSTSTLTLIMMMMMLKKNKLIMKQTIMVIDLLLLLL